MTAEDRCREYAASVRKSRTPRIVDRVANESVNAILVSMGVICMVLMLLWTL